MKSSVTNQKILSSGAKKKGKKNRKMITVLDIVATD